MSLAWNRISRTVPSENKEQVGVAFVAILFGIVVGLTVADLAGEVRAGIDSTSEIRLSRFTHLLVGVFLTVFSFLGYFASQNRPKHKIHFFNWPLALFVLDVLMVFDYYLVLRFTESFAGAGASHSTIADARPEAFLIAAAFFLYVVWDYVSWKISSDEQYQEAIVQPVDKSFGARRRTTCVFFVISVLVTAIVWIWNPTSEIGVAVVDGMLVVMLFVYRIAKPLFDPGISTRSG